MCDSSNIKNIKIFIFRFRILKKSNKTLYVKIHILNEFYFEHNHINRFLLL